MRPCAVVVGLCAHGLTIARSLHAAGVRVVALEVNRNLPGTRTRCADVRFVSDINGPGLIDALVRLAPALGLPTPVLFLTNDRMIETVGAHADSIARRYRLSWANARAALLPLLRKDQIESRCAETGLHYPKTRLIEDLGALSARVADLRFPLIVKPTKPISAFKTIVAHTTQELDRARTLMAASMPVIVQEFIAGDDASIRFGALYLNNGEIVARFEGCKLRSKPMGHTTIAVSERNNEIHELARRFFGGLRLSGPVSLELKRGPDGTQWVIEPTVGRSDFWVGLCVANGVDLPLIEYRVESAETHDAYTQEDSHVWVNGERDPGAIGWLLAHAPRRIFTRRLRGVYADRKDIRPFIAAFARHASSLPSRAVRKAGKVVLGP